MRCFPVVKTKKKKKRDQRNDSRSKDPSTEKKRKQKGGRTLSLLLSFRLKAENTKERTYVTLKSLTWRNPTEKKKGGKERKGKKNIVRG